MENLLGKLQDIGDYLSDLVVAEERVATILEKGLSIDKEEDP